MRQLVPDRRSPVVLADLSRRRRMHCEHAAEADAQGPESGQADGAHREVAVAPIDLEANGGWWLVAVSRGELVEAFVEQFQQIGREERRLAPVHDEMEAIGARLAVLTERVE